MNPCFHSLLLELIMLQEIHTICIYWILLSSPLSNDPMMEYILLFLDDEADVFYLTLVKKCLHSNMIINVFLHSIIIVLHQYYLYKLVSL